MKLPGLTQEPLLHVDATPDAEYPLRILRAHRENCNCRWASDTENVLLNAMNQMNDARANLLDEAIAKLAGDK